MKTTKQTDIFKDTMASAELCDKPPGVSVLNWVTDRGERAGNRQRTVSAAVRARIAAHEAAQVARTAKAISTKATAAVRALPAAPANLLDRYNAMPRGSAKAAFLSEHGDQLISLQRKQNSN